MAIRIEPASEALGARVTGINLRREPDAESWGIIHQGPRDPLGQIGPWFQPFGQLTQGGTGLPFEEVP